jgi:hypothetical protein
MENRIESARTRYLTFFAAVCTIASLQAGAGAMLGVWLVVAAGLGLFGKILTGKSSCKSKCKD